MPNKPKQKSGCMGLGIQPSSKARSLWTSGLGSVSSTIARNKQDEAAQNLELGSATAGLNQTQPALSSSLTYTSTSSYYKSISKTLSICKINKMWCCRETVIKKIIYFLSIPQISLKIRNPRQLNLVKAARQSQPFSKKRTSHAILNYMWSYIIPELTFEKQAYIYNSTWHWLYENVYILYTAHFAMLSFLSFIL